MGVDDPEVTSPDTSTDETLDDAVVGSEAQASVDLDTDADPSPAAKDAKPDSMLSVVRDAVPPRAPGPSPDEAAAAKDTATPPTVDNETFKDVPFHTHPRFQGLVRERNQLREPARRFGQLMAYCADNAMTQEDLAAAVNLFALRKRDPEKAWVELKPIVQELLLEIGEILPPDLRAQVAAGTYSPDVAKAIAKERARANVVKGQQTFEQQRAAGRQQQSAATAQFELLQSIANEVTAWEAATKKTDLDYAKKELLVKKEVLFMQHRDGKPQTPEDVKKQLNDAYKAVNAAIRAQRPAPRNIRPVIGGGTAPAAIEKPKDMLDVVRMAGRAH